MVMVVVEKCSWILYPVPDHHQKLNLVSSSDW